MRFLIVTHVPHCVAGDQFYAYGPYVQEMNLWEKQVEELIIVAPIEVREPEVIELPYLHQQLELIKVKPFSFISLSAGMAALLRLPGILLKLFRQMRKADHIHLRCPGNMGLLGAIVQVFYPSKQKTAKYAGNWDPDAKQPLSYRFQKWILSNTLLTRNMQVLVYGDWPGQTKNVKPFFTATYRNSDFDTAVLYERADSPIRFMFAGTLSPGKRPLYALKLAQKIGEQQQVVIDFYGEGKERGILEKYIEEQGLSSWVKLHGNVDKSTVLQAFQKSHFLVLPSQSEGWPKVVAEAMCWGCIPIVTKISCVPWMLGEGERGVLIDLDLEEDAAKVNLLLADDYKRQQVVSSGSSWSRQYTLNRFEIEIGKLLK